VAVEAPFAYSRSSGEGGSVTVFFRRRTEQEAVGPAERAVGHDQPDV
jgi:hypothetical protein